MYFALCPNCLTRTEHEIVGDEIHSGPGMRRTTDCQNCGANTVETWEFRGYERVDSEAAL